MSMIQEVRAACEYISSRSHGLALDGSLESAALVASPVIKQLHNVNEINYSYSMTDLVDMVKDIRSTH